MINNLTVIHSQINYNLKYTENSPFYDRIFSNDW